MSLLTQKLEDLRSHYLYIDQNISVLEQTYLEKFSFLMENIRYWLNDSIEKGLLSYSENEVRLAVSDIHRIVSKEIRIQTSFNDRGIDIIPVGLNYKDKHILGNVSIEKFSKDPSSISILFGINLILNKSDHQWYIRTSNKFDILGAHDYIECDEENFTNLLVDFL